MPGYIEAMRLALPDKSTRTDPESDPGRWALLPGLCCQAAGGDPGWSDDISAAWFLLYMAAHLYDDLQDQDEPNPWWREIGAGAAINIASGLVLSGLGILNSLHDRHELGLAASEICTRFYANGFKMSSGQHLDLVKVRTGVEEWFKIAEAKSGSFFDLACWAGARLAIYDVERLDGFSRFGSNLGVLLQIHDDLDDLRKIKIGDFKGSFNELMRSLPFAYALDVCSYVERIRIVESLQAAQDQKDASQDVLNLLEQCGAALYIRVEIERRQQVAREALELARPHPSTVEEFYTFLRKLEVNVQSG